MRAVVGGQHATFLEIAARGADPAAKDWSRMNALAHAVNVGNEPAIEFLLGRHRFDLSEPFVDGYTLLHLAVDAERPSANVIRRLTGSPTCAHNAPFLGLTPLHYAVHKSMAFAVDALLESESVDANLSDQHGNSLLHTALITGNIGTVHFLLTHPSADLGHRNLHGETPLHQAVKSRSNAPSLALQLFEADRTGAIDVNAKDNGGDTPLHAVAKRGDFDTGLILMSRGADVNAVNGTDDTVMQTALRFGNTRIVGLLMGALNSGSIHVDLNRINASQEALVHAAVLSGRPENLELLLNAGQIDVSVVDSEGNTPLHLACIHGPEEAVSLLVGKSDIMAKNAEGNTPLHMAAMYGKVDAIRILMDAADPTYTRVQNGDGKIAREVAEGFGYNSAADLLMSFGAIVAYGNLFSFLDRLKKEEEEEFGRAL